MRLQRQSRAITAAFLSAGLIGTGIVAKARNVHLDESVAKSGASTTAEQQNLLLFGRNNPECAMWTDWHKLCARMGSGRVECRADSARTVKASTPFCVAGEQANAESASIGLNPSAMRFCRKKQTEYGHSRRDEESYQVCARFAPDRPFNGRRIASLDHEACDIWSDANSGIAVCSNNNGLNAKLPACSELAKKRYEHKNLLICSAWSAAMKGRCKNPQPTESTPWPGAEIIIPDRPRYSGLPANGVYCDD